MIITRLLGGLGNQMFQYAAGRALAYRHKTELKLDISGFKIVKGITPRDYGLSPFSVTGTFASEKEVRCMKKPLTPLRFFLAGIGDLISGNEVITYKKEPFFHYDPAFQTFPDNVYLDGYWQSEKYFRDIEKIIRSEFTLKKEPDEPDKQMAEKISGSNAISIHIRRGDYIANPVTHNHHGVCPLEYYQTAINHMVTKCPDPHFYIFSDDPAWVKQNLAVHYPHTCVTHNLNIRDSSDLWLMSLCKHHIIANSSFSWWGAWLSDNPEKMVIAPKRWVNDPNVDTRDLIPESWQFV